MTNDLKAHTKAIEVLKVVFDTRELTRAIFAMFTE